LAKTGAIVVGLMGLGVVGGGVARVLHEKQAAIAGHLGKDVVVKSVLVRDPSKIRNDAAPGLSITANAQDLLGDPEIDVIVEVMGGEHPALEYIQSAIRAGKHVVTANKEVMAKHGPEILTLAGENGISVRFEASVGGGIPIIGPLLQDLLANDMTAVHAIINGTTNYILTSMAREGLGFDVALKNAQELGYAEADPANDILGLDAAYKLAVLSTLAFHSKVHASEVYYEGIDKLAAEDFQYAAELGYVIKLLAIGQRNGDTIQVRVHPAFVPIAHPLAKVDGVLNAVELHGDLVGRVMFQGPGAGDMPTTSAVIGDVLEIARSVASGGQPSPPPRLDRDLVIQAMPEVETKYYLRLHANDKPGVMAQVTRVLGDHQVSLASVIQKASLQADGLAEIVITTHEAKESGVQDAVQRLSELDVVKEVCNLVRIEELV